MSCPPCPHCQSEFVYQDQSLFICPECAHEWNPSEAEAEETVTVKDAHGTLLAEGDKVTMIKDLKVKDHHSCRAHLAPIANPNSSIRIKACSSAPNALTNGTLLRLRQKRP